jgi:heat shock protein HslJ
VRVTAGGQLRFNSDTAHPVITGDAPNHVEIEMAQVQTPARRGLPEVTPAVAGEGDAAAEQPPPPMRGLVTYLAEAARFSDCATGRSYPIAMEGDYEALEHAYLAAGQEPGMPMMASFDGSIADRPKADSASTEPTVVVDRFVGVWPGEDCAPQLVEATLTDTYWKIVRLAEFEISAGEGRREPHLVLRSEDAHYRATVGCNELVGSFTLYGDDLSFGQGASTRMACLPPLDAWEQQLAGVLEATAAWRIDGQALELIDGDGAAIATFRAVYLP